MGYINADIPDAGRMLFSGSWNAELWPPLKASFDENKGKAFSSSSFFRLTIYLCCMTMIRRCFNSKG